jgi:hypothetical protein
MKIPYGTSDFGDIRSGGLFYVDKTPFLPVLERPESGYRHVLFLRPRRFGKSTLLSPLKNYYDIGRKEQFDQIFEGLWIHEHPTAERNSYLGYVEICVVMLNPLVMNIRPKRPSRSRAEQRREIQRKDAEAQRRKKTRGSIYNLMLFLRLRVLAPLR